MAFWHFRFSSPRSRAAVLGGKPDAHAVAEVPLKRHWEASREVVID